jgi:hypothetical protein
MLCSARMPDQARHSIGFLLGGFSFSPRAVPATIAAAIATATVVLLGEDHVAFRGEVIVAGLERLR